MLRAIQEGAFTRASRNIINDNFALLAGYAFGAGAYGSIFQVNPVTGNDNSGDGSTEAPLKTIAKAMAFVVSGRGDSVVLQAGTYTENVVISKDYVTLIGATVGGYARPDIVPVTGVPVTVTGQGAVLAHLRMAGVANDACVQQGNGFLIVDCVFDGDLTAAKAGLRLVPSNTLTSRTASEGIVTSSYFRGSAFGIVFDTALPAVGVGSTDNWIYNNRFSRNTVDVATADTGVAATYSVEFLVLGPGNQFEDKNKAVYIDMTTANGGPNSAQSGAINGNTFASDGLTGVQIKMTGTAFTFAGNFSTIGVVDGSGFD